MTQKFSFDTVKEFDNHISNSIFWYDILHSLIINISWFFIKNGVIPVDLWCTSWKLLKEIERTYECKSIWYDILSKNFIEWLDLRVQDITEEDFEIPMTNIIYSIFTLQFIAYDKRLNVLKKIYNSLHKNWVLIICEKEISSNWIIQEVFTFSNYWYKKQNFTSDEILNKEKDLRSIMNSLEAKDNIELLKKAWFQIIEPFFQSLNYKGYICKK
jgi:tRNA (cmo5U34)-methyltransferase